MSTAVATTNGTGNGSRAIAASQDIGKAMEAVMINGDLGALTPMERSQHYMRVCDSLGLNPLTKPFAYMKLNGKLTLYALRDAADQLRKLNGVSVEIIDRKIVNGLCTVHVRAKCPDGRQDEDMGVVNIDGLAGEAAANAILKAITKAKRRVTLSICGLGWSDETETDSIPGAQLLGSSPDGLFQDQDGYLAHLEEEMADTDARELDEVWQAHIANSQHRLGGTHAIKALKLYEAHKARIAAATKD